MKQLKLGLLTRNVLVLLFALTGRAAGQENLPLGPSNYEQPFQLFAPFDLDLDNMADDQWSGYFFEYNKLYWSYSGERATVGSPNVTELIDTNGDGIGDTNVQGMFAEIIYQVNPNDDLPNPMPGGVMQPGRPRQPITQVPMPYLVQNTLHDVPPKAGFAFGNRYEFGYRDHDYGWQISILDGPELNQNEFYGFVRQDTNGDGIPDGLPPFRDPDYTNGSDIANDGNIFQQANGPIAGFDTRAFGWGSVPVLFEAPPGFFDGFRDYLNYLADAVVGTQAGPMLYVGNYGMVEETELYPDDADVTIPVFRIADDIDGDGIAGSDIIILIDPVTDQIRLAVVKDFDDLHRFNVFFDNVRIHNRTETDGVELMWSHQLTNQHYMAKHQNNRLIVSAGARFLRLYDEFNVTAEGSILHDAFWNTSFRNQIVGPQLGLTWINERQRWRILTDLRFMFGYNVADWDQVGLIGFGLVPGGLNQPLYARPTAFSHGLREQDFSPVGELRVQASYHLFAATALKFGYTGSYVGNIRRAAPSVRYSMPSMGYVDTGGEDFLINGFDFGVEFVY